MNFSDFVKRQVKNFLNLRTGSLVLIFLLVFVLTLPVLSRIPTHPDEHQFYFNAFRIMEGQELHNYLHVASTEYALAGFLYVMNLITTPGVNFPQGDPTAVTFYYGKIFGFLLYLISAIFGSLILQRNEKKLKLRTIIFNFLFFGSIAMFERFLRVNSDSFTIFIFLNFVILSFWQHHQKASVIELFFLNTLFIFLGTFTNLKSLYLILPLVLINVVAPFIWYEKTKVYLGKRLPTIYRLILYGIGVVALCLLLWVFLVPKPFSSVGYWYGLKKTIIHGTMFDFDYPSQSNKSALVYLYDLIVYQINLYAFFPMLFIFVAAYFIKKRQLFIYIKRKFLDQLNFKNLNEGNLYGMTELILFASFFSYYIGVSTRVVHWSRWGSPLGFLALMILSTLLEKLLEIIFGGNKKEYGAFASVLPYILIFAWVPRIILTFDLYKTGFSVKDDFFQTTIMINDYLKEKNASKDEAAWFTGYTPNIKSISFEEVVKKENKDVKYLFWPYWNIGVVYTKKSVDKETHIQRAFIDKYVKNIEYSFPTGTSRYIHATKKFAWNVLGITWNPEIDSLVESQYAILELNKPFEELELQYNLSYNELPHYESYYSRVFNLKNLKDSYMFAPCYTYDAVKSLKSGEWVDPPPEIGLRARTAGLYCHSARFRVLPKGIYYITVRGLPKDSEGKQKAYYSLGNFSWDLQSKTAAFVLPETAISGEFGVATEKRLVPGLNFEVTYILNQELLEAIDNAIEEAQEQITE